MPLLDNKEPVVEHTPEKKTPKDRFLLGSTGCYFEVAEYLAGNPKITEKSVKALGNSPAMYLADTEGEGRSLKVMKKTDPKKDKSYDGEIKFNGFVTAGDKKVELWLEEHGDMILDAWKTEAIVRAISADELVDSWSE